MRIREDEQREHAMHLRLAARPPFRLEPTVWILRRIAANRVDRWDGQAYSRVLIVRGQPVAVQITQQGSMSTPILRISADCADEVKPPEIKQLISTIFGLSIDLSGFYEMTRRDKQLRQLTAPFIGMRPTRFPTIFEALLNAIACQQVSLQSGLQILNRLSEAFGRSYKEMHAFPTPDDLAWIRPSEIKEVGFSLRKAESISTIAKAIAGGEFNLETLATLADEDVISRLTSFPGIGRWSAEYVLLRGLGRLHCFPGDDVGGAAKLQKWLSLKSRPGYSDIRELLKRWHPYEGLIYFHLLLRSLQEKGLIGCRG